MSKLVETLKQAGWVETTTRECREGEEVFPLDAGMPRGKITRKDSGRKVFIDSYGPFTRARLVLRAPRLEPDYPEGTVVRGVADGMKTNLIWIGHDTWTAAEGYYSTSEVEVLRVLAHPDGTTPTPEPPVWDPERHYPQGTMVEADWWDGRSIFVSDGDAPEGFPWSLINPESVGVRSNSNMKNPLVLFIPKPEGETYE